MRRPTALDWLGATVIWGVSSVVFGVFLSEGIGFDEEVGVIACLGMFMSGIVAARLWVLRQPEREPNSLRRSGLTTGEATLDRLDELELRLSDVETLHARIADLEERLDFSERLLTRPAERNPAERHGA